MNDVLAGFLLSGGTGLMGWVFLGRKWFTRLRSIVLLTFSAGVFWEGITPLYLTHSVRDPWDLAAYISGGILYWSLFFLLFVYNEHKDLRFSEDRLS
ncbi:hypothetical protein [Alkalicoccus urumqiensis]|nr:hypothetical protein [Alkalicoccus urumqiensis]